MQYHKKQIGHGGCVISNFITPAITFETKCYEKDWKLLLASSYLESQIDSCNIRFDIKQLIINNVEDEKIVRRYADKAVSKNIIDSYFFVSDYADAVLEKYNIEMDSFKGGYLFDFGTNRDILLRNSVSPAFFRGRADG